MRPSKPITAISSRPWRRAISRSFGSWPGVTLSAPVPTVGIDVLVADDRHLALGQRHDRALADQVRVALVGRVDGDGGVAEQRHRAHGRDGHVAAADERVVHGVHRVVDLDVLDLEIGDRRVRRRCTS